MEYEYELRKGSEVIATGLLSEERPLAVGDRLTVGQNRGIVRAVIPKLGGQPTRVTVEVERS
jgi:hypothetical protein